MVEKNKIKLAGMYLLIAVLVVIGVMACNGNSARPSSEFVADNTTAGKATSGMQNQIKPLDDAENPYAGQYLPIDYWGYDNFVKIKLPGETWLPEDGSRVQMSWRIDSNGYLLPLLEMYAQGSTPHIVGDANDYLTWPSACVTATPPEDIYNDWVIAWEQQRAEILPEVPGWLGSEAKELLPKYTVFLPNGQIATQGLVGQPAESLSEDDGDATSDCCGGSSKDGPWVLYSPDGEILRSSNHNMLTSLFVDNFEDSQIFHDMVAKRGDGIIECLDSDGNTYFVDYDGTMLGAEEPTEVRGRMVYLSPEHILHTYEIQQKYGG